MAGKRKRPRKSTETVLSLESSATCLNPNVSLQENAIFPDTLSDASFAQSFLNQDYSGPSSSAHQHSRHSTSVAASSVSRASSLSSNRPQHLLPVDNRRVSFNIPYQTELTRTRVSPQLLEPNTSVYFSGTSAWESIPIPSTSYSKSEKALSSTLNPYHLTGQSSTDHGEKRPACKKPRTNSPQGSVNYSAANYLEVPSGSSTSGTKKRRRDRQKQLSRSAGVTCAFSADTESASCPVPFGIDLSYNSSSLITHGVTVLSGSGSGTAFTASMLSGGVGSDGRKIQTQACTVSNAHHDLRSRHQNVPCQPIPYLLPASLRPTPLSGERPNLTQNDMVSQRHVFTAPGDSFSVPTHSELVSSTALHHIQQPCTSVELSRCAGQSTHPFVSCTPTSSIPVSLTDRFSCEVRTSVNLSYLPTSANACQSLRGSNLVPTSIEQSATVGDLIHPQSTTTACISTASHYKNTDVTSTSSLTTGSLIPLFPHTPHVSVIIPSTVDGSLGSTKQQQQPVLSPISVARLISFNPSHSASRILRPAPTSDSGCTRASQSFPSSVQSTSSPSKYSKHLGQLSSDTGRVPSSWSRGSTSQSLGRHSPLTTGINHRIVQLQQHRSDRSMQLIILQDINQILLMGFEDNLSNLNIHGLVSCILDILDCEEEHLVELKNLGCNVLTHMMDVLPRSADAVVPALPLLLTTMSCSFVGDILERIINLLEQLSRRHGREVLQSGAIASVLGFYDFVTLAQHRTILTMVANCFTDLQRSDFDLLIDCLPSLSERLKESDPRCVERVCTCFARLVTAYRSEPELLKRIVNSCHLFANLQHLLMASPSVLSGVRDVIHMLAILCSSCPDLAVDLIQLNISSSLYCILTGLSVDTDALRKTLLEPFNKAFMLADGSRFLRSISRDRSNSESDRKRSSTSRSSRAGSEHQSDLSLGSDATAVWQPLMLSASPLRDYTGSTILSLNARSQEDIHAVVQLICELLPPVPTPSSGFLAFTVHSQSQSFGDLIHTDRFLSASYPAVGHAVCDSLPPSNKTVKSGDQRHTPQRSESDRSSSHKSSDRRRRSGASQSNRLSIPFNQLAINDAKSAIPPSPVSFGCTGTLTRTGCLVTGYADPRACLLRAECDWLHHQLQIANLSTSNSSEWGATLSRRQRRSSGRRHSLEQFGSSDKIFSSSGNSEHDSGVDASHPAGYQGDTMEYMHLVQTLLPLLFELFNEATKLHTRLQCLEAIQRMLFYASPVLLAKTLHPRLTCSHIVGMLNCPERRIVLYGLQITLSLIERIPPMFATHFRKEGILHQVELLKSQLADQTKFSFRISSPSSLHHTPPDSAICHRTDQLRTSRKIPKEPSLVTYGSVTDLNSPSSVLPWTHGYHSYAFQNAVTSPSAGDSAHFTRIPENPDTVLSYLEGTPGHRIRTISALSAPILPTLGSGSDDSAASDSTLSFAIEHACHQLQSRVGLLLDSASFLNTSTSTPAASHSSKLHSFADISDSSHVDTDASLLNPIDLMPKLAAVTSYLNSDKPNLWILAFSRLIELLRPPQSSSPTPVEPPSPFELQRSGVTAALLSYFTEPDSREIRLQIAYRLFFGARAKSATRLLPACTALCVAKKRGMSKSGPQLMSLSPPSLSCGKEGCIRELDDFIDRQLEEFPDRLNFGPEAFATLIDCLLACFHRHEHFQVIGLPSSPPINSKLLAIFNSYWFGSDVFSQSTASLEQSGQDVCNSRNLRTSQKACDPSTSRSGSRSRNQRSHSSKSTGIRSSHVCTSQSDDKIPESRSSHSALYPVESQLVPPAPGLVWIDLVRLTDIENVNDASPKNAFRSSTSGFSKSGRKSSSSSTSSNLSAISASGFESHPSVPDRLSLHITALATFQLLERLLLQRNEINSVLHDGIPLGHDYGIPSFPEGYSNYSSREAELRGFLDSAPRNDEDTDGSGELSEDRVPTILNLKLSSDLHSAAPAVKQQSHTSGRPNRSRGASGHSRRVNSDRLPKPNSSGEVLSPVPVILDPMVSLISHAQYDVPLLSLPNSETTLPPALRLNSSAHSQLNLVPSDVTVAVEPNREPTQRSLRSLLQRTAEVPSLVAFDLVKAAGLNSCSSHDYTQSCSSTESWSLRRRSVARPANPIPRSNAAESLNPIKYGVAVCTPHDFSGFPNSSTSLNSTPRGRTDTDLSSVSAPQKCHPLSSSGSSRHRRLKSSSIFAAFGALANLSSSSLMSSGGHKHLAFTTNRANATATTTTESDALPSTRRSCSGTDPHPTSSLSTSSMSPNSDSGFNLRDRPRYRVVFYIGGHKLPLHLPLFEAIRRFSPEFNRHLSALREGKQKHCVNEDSSNDLLFALTEREVEDLTGHLMWSMRHAIQYRLVTCGTSTNTSASVFRKSDPTSAYSVSAYLPKTFMNLSVKVPDPLSLSFAGSSNPFASAVTCLKRRRSEDVTDTSFLNASGKFSACHSRTPSCQTLNSFINTTHGVSIEPATSNLRHPLLVNLTRDLPQTSFPEARCLCACDDTSATDSPDTHYDLPPKDDYNWDEDLSQPLALLRVLYHITCLWYTTHDLLDPFPIISPFVFHSSKIAIKASRQLQDVFNLLAGNLPTWLIRLVSTCPFLFPFEIRRTFLYVYNFDRDRMLLRLQDSTSSSITEIEQQMSAVPRTFTTPSSSSVRGSSTWGTASPNSVSSTLGSEPSSTALVTSSLSSLGSNCWSVIVSGNDSAPQALSNVSLPHRSDAHRRAAIRSRYHTRLALTPILKRHKVTVFREGKRLLRQAEATLNELLDSRAVLEIAFDGEVGFGLGPTLEFYTLVSRQLMRSSLALWHGNEVTADGYVIPPPPGLYPRPLSRQARSSVVREVRSKFLFLGRLLARALLDWRQLDLAFSPAFFKWFLAPTPTQAVLEGHILPTDLALVDPELGRHVSRLTEMSNHREALCHRLEQIRISSMNCTNTHHSSGVTPPRHGASISKLNTCSRSAECDEHLAALLALDNDIQELCLTFVLPGYEVELLKNGSHILVTGSNLKDYLRLLAHWLVIEGAIRQMEAVIEGFDSVLPGVRHRLALLFRPEEMEGLFCGRSSSQVEMLLPVTGAHSVNRVSSAAEGWDVQSLTEACRCDHGYTPQSRTIRNLFEVMSEFTEEQRRLFVQFVTGSPRLPVGGFRALKPPLKIVMKREDGENADNHLPSVMTCQNYLKLPDYSSKELLLSKLLYAIHEGQNAFHLS